MKSMGGLSTRRSWAARYDASIRRGRRIGRASPTPCGICRPSTLEIHAVGEKLADEKNLALTLASEETNEILSAIAPRSRGLSGGDLMESNNTLHSKVSNSKLTPQIRAPTHGPPSQTRPAR